MGMCHSGERLHADHVTVESELEALVVHIVSRISHPRNSHRGIIDLQAKDVRDRKLIRWT